MSTYDPLQIFLAGRNIICNSAEDRELLSDAKALEISPADAVNLTVGRLYLIRDACQRYSLGKRQRLTNRAIERAGL